MIHNIKDKLYFFYAFFYKEVWQQLIVYEVKLFIAKYIKKNSDLHQYKNIVKDKRCFIVGTGPSLKIEDLNMLYNEDCFSANSITMAYDKTSWRPKYYSIIDENVYKTIKDTICFSDYEQIFYGYNIKGFSQKGIKLLVNYRHNIRKRFRKEAKYDVSKDVSYYVEDGNTVVYVMIQLAMYMGYNKIYLLGVDCNYTKSKNNHFSEYGQKNNDLPQYGYDMIDAFYSMNQLLKDSDVKIYNATRGGSLEVFQRVNFDDLF